MVARVVERKYMRIKTIQHLNPIWKDEADFIIGIELKNLLPGFDLVREQLWSKKKSDDIFMVCCIPFLAYDLSLGDEVAIDSSYMIKQIVKRSGLFTYRVWFGDTKYPQIRNILNDELEQIGCSLEWYSSDLLAISCCKEDSQTVADLLFKKEENGLIKYETGKTR